MDSLNYDIQDKLKRLTIFEKIIAVNTKVAIVAALFRIIDQKSRECPFYQTFFPER